jgi:phage terminase small subunit
MLTGKQEAFAQGIVSGLSQADAYRGAYQVRTASDKTIHETASRLMADPKVAARVLELRQPVVAKLRYGLEQAMLEAADALQVSKSKDNGSAMVAAIALRAKLNGLLVDRKEIVLTEVQQLDDETLDRLIALKTIEAGMAPATMLIEQSEP